MKHFAGTALVVLSTMLLGFYALVWLTSPVPPLMRAGAVGVLLNAVGICGLVFAVMAFRELRLQAMAAKRIKQENEGFI